VIATATDLDGGRPFGQLIDAYRAAQERGEPVGQPALAETVYIESLTDNGLSIAAGNRVTTFWRLQLLLSLANSVSGSFWAADVYSSRWPRNVWNLNGASAGAAHTAAKTVPAYAFSECISAQ
jgi:hypothetical protein